MPSWSRFTVRSAGRLRRERWSSTPAALVIVSLSYDGDRRASISCWMMTGRQSGAWSPTWTKRSRRWSIAVSRTPVGLRRHSPAPAPKCRKPIDLSPPPTPRQAFFYRAATVKERQRRLLSQTTAPARRTPTQVASPPAERQARAWRPFRPIAGGSYSAPTQCGELSADRRRRARYRP